MKYNIQNANAVSNRDNVSMDFKIGNAAVIIDILRNRLYSDKIRVVVQEYLCNARDAMREAGNTSDRIEVTLPTKKKPTLIIRDFGPGLSPDRVADVFVQLGNSTKRTSETQTGGFGIGGKSAFAYTDSFTVISNFNGVETHYVAHVGKNSVGTLEKVHEKKSDAKPGVEIQIGVNKTADDEGLSDVDRFNSMVYRTICFWKPEEIPTVLNDYDANSSCDWLTLHERIKKEEGFITDKAIVLHPNNVVYNSSSDTMLVIDGIIYDLDDDHDSKQYDSLRSATWNSDTYLLFPAGVLEISASREAIAVNQANKAVLSQAMADALKSITSKAHKLIANVKTIQDAKETCDLLAPISGTAKDVKRKVEGITVKFSNATIVETGIEGMHSSVSRRRRRNSVSLADVHLDAFFIHNDDGLAESTLETKIRELSKSRGDGHYAIIAQDKTEFAETLKATPISSLKAQRVYSEKEKVPEGKVNLRVFRGHRDVTEYDHVDTTDTDGVTYVLVENAETREQLMKFRAMQTFFDEFSEANVKFTFPSRAALKAVTGKPGFVKQADFFANPAKFMGDSKFKNSVGLLKQLHAYNVKSEFETLYEVSSLGKKIADEKFTKLAKVLTSIKLDKDEGKDQRESWAKVIIEDANIKAVFGEALGEVAEMSEFVNYVNETYPLIREIYSYSRTDKSEIVHYINGKYAALNKAA